MNEHQEIVMTQYIPKDALVAEIERRKSEINSQIADLGNFESDNIGLFDYLDIYDDVLDIINTLEVKKVDSFIEKAVKYLKDNVTYIHPRKGTEKCIFNIPKFIDHMKGE